MSEYILQPSEVEGEEEGDEAVRTRRRRRVRAVLMLFPFNTVEAGGICSSRKPAL